jgi:hypothetical protein
MGVVRILIWNLGDAKTSLEELRQRIDSIDGGVWISNEAAERFGLIAFGEPPDLSEVRALVGKDPEVAEEFDLEDL